MTGGIGIGADLEQRADKRQRAVVNRVFEARANRQRHRPIRHAGWIIDRGPQRGVDLLEFLVFRASLSVRLHLAADCLGFGLQFRGQREQAALQSKIIGCLVSESRSTGSPQ